MTENDPSIMVLKIYKMIRDKNFKDATVVATVLYEDYYDEPEAHYLYGVVLFLSDNLERSRKALLQAVEMFPEYWKFYQLLGHIYNKILDFSLAEKAFRDAIAHFNENDKKEKAILYFYLGDAMWSKLNRDGARKQWKQALKINPQCKEAKVALKETANDYGDSLAPNPIFDDLYHFQGIQLARYYELVGRNEFTSDKEAQEIISLIMFSWNDRVQPHQTFVDNLTPAERTKFFENINLNFMEAVIRWK